MNKKQNKDKLTKLKLVQLVLLTVLFMTGLWAVDIGASAMVMQAAGQEVVVQTLLVKNNPAFHYHVGLLLSLFAFIAMFYTGFIQKNARKNN